MGTRHIWVDRKRLFILNLPFISQNEENSIEIRAGIYSLGKWKLKVEEDIYSFSHSITNWKEGWQGYLKTYLPIGNHYQLIFTKKKNINQMKEIKKNWIQAKIPSFFFPTILSS